MHVRGFVGPEDVRSPRNEVIGGYEMCNMSDRNQSQVLLKKKAVNDLKYQPSYLKLSKIYTETVTVFLLSYLIMH